MKLKSIKVVRNMWGNYVGFIGTERSSDSAHEIYLIDWLSDKLAEGGYKLSDKSEITMEQVEAWREEMAKPVQRVPPVRFDDIDEEPNYEE